MNKEFWSEVVTRASWEKMQELSKNYDFIVIGGWSAYLWTKMHKSKDAYAKSVTISIRSFLPLMLSLRSSSAACLSIKRHSLEIVFIPSITLVCRSNSATGKPSTENFGV